MSDSSPPNKLPNEPSNQPINQPTTNRPAANQPTIAQPTADQPTVDKQFRTRWILGNALAYSVGIGLPILFADLSLAYDYVLYATTAFLTASVWVGVAQWLILRQQFPISPQWMFNVAIAPLVSSVLPLTLLSTSPFALLLLFITYPLTHAVLQWQLLRQCFQPATGQKIKGWTVKGWIFTSAIATLLGSSTAITFGIVGADAFLFLPLGIIAIISGLFYGLLYGVITGRSLRQLTKQNYVAQPNQTGLDVPPDAKSWQITLLPTVGLVAIAIAWIAIIPPLPVAAIESLPAWLFPLTVFGILFAYTYLAILIHELGHLLFALTRGFELKAFSVHRWILACQGKHWQIFKTQKRYAGGFILPIPKSLRHFSYPALMAMISGGPIASFLLFGIGTIPLFFPVWMNNIFVWLIVACSSISLHTAIFNALPLKLGYLRTDGRRLLDLAQNNPAGQRFAALYGVNASSKQGIRPGDLDPTFVEQAVALPENSSDHVAGLLIAYAHTLDRGELEKAGHYLDQALDLQLYFPELFRGSLLLEGTFFEAHIRHRAEAARQWFDKITETALIPPYALHRAEAALLLAEGNRTAAREKAQQGLESVLRDRFMKGDAIAEEERLSALLQKINRPSQNNE